ncbi:TPA: hypothetical protein ACH3X1_005282 [Trebouxia sp. C0004]
MFSRAVSEYRRSCVHYRQRCSERANCTAGNLGQLQAQSGCVSLLLLMLMHPQASNDCSSKGRLQPLAQLDLAGVMACPEGHTKEGFETQFGTNHAAHFLLFQLLKPALLASSTPELNSRLVSVPSSGHEYSGILFDDLNLKKQGYDMWKAYRQSKTANVYLANEVRDTTTLHSSALVASPVVEPYCTVHCAGLIDACWIGLMMHALCQSDQLHAAASIAM